MDIDVGVNRDAYGNESSNAVVAIRPRIQARLSDAEVLSMICRYQAFDVGNAIFNAGTL